MLGSPVWSFLTSWCFYLGGIIGAAFVLNAFGVYMHQFLAHQISVVGWALISAIALTLINLGPASEIGKIETILVIGKLIILLLLIGFGIAHFQPHDILPFAPHGTSQVFATSSFLFIAFLGFSVLTSISGDIENPRKTVPQAILLSMVIVTVVYAGIVVALLAAHITDYSEASVGVAARHLIGPIGGSLVIMGALISTLSSANANILGSSEIMVRLAANKEVPTIMGHLRHGHPYVSVMAAAALYFVLILTHQTLTVIGLANVTAIVALIIVNIAAAKALRSKSHTGLRLPLGWLLPMLGTVGAILQCIFIPLPTLIFGIMLAGSGLAIYALRNRYHLPQLHRRIVSVVDHAQGPLRRSL